MPLSITEAILGCKITVETAEGKRTVHVKPGTNGGDEMVLKKHGFEPFHPPDHYDVHQLKGDHILRFKVVIPQNMTEKQREILREFQRMEQARYYQQSEQHIRQRHEKAAKKDQQQKQEQPKKEQAT